MPRKSTIEKLPPEIRAELDRLVRDGGYTIDAIVAHLRLLGGEVKRSAVGAYRQRMEARLARVREAKEVAGVWVAKLGEQPDSATGQLLAELLSTLAFRTLADMNDQEEGAEPGELMLLAKALKDLAGAQKTDQEYRERLRRVWEDEQRRRAAEAAAEARDVAREKGLSEEDANRIRSIVLGVVG